MKSYFVTEGNSNNYVMLNFMAKSIIDADYLSEAKRKVQAEFVNLGELYTILGNTNGEGTEIILSKYSFAFEKVLKVKYPKAEFENYQLFGEKVVN